MAELIFGERIKRIRENKKLTQREFAQMVGVTAATVNSWEKSGKFPSVDMAAKIADTFGVSLDWLCGRERPRKITNIGELMSTINEIVQAFSQHPHGQFALQMSSYTSKDGKMEYGGRIDFVAPEYFIIFTDWCRLLELYNSGVVIESVYNAWIKDRCSILEKYDLEYVYRDNQSELIEDWAGKKVFGALYEDLIKNCANTEAHHEQESE